MRQTRLLETQVSPRAVIRRFRETLRQGVPSTVLHAADNDLDNVMFETIVDAALKGDALLL